MTYDKCPMIEPQCDRQMLYQWYIIEKRSYRFIFRKLGFNNARTLKALLLSFGIPIRTKSEAVATQWINNPLRRKQTSKRAQINLAPFWGQKVSEESRKKISKSKRGANNPMYGIRGALHHHWLGGKKSWEKGRRISTLKKQEIRSQLGDKCARCGVKTNLTINHKIPWRIVRHYELWNLELLCKKCHFSGPNKDR